MDSLTPEEIQEFRDIFNLVDKVYFVIRYLLQDGGGSISEAELGELLDTLGVSTRPVCFYDNICQEEISLMIQEIDQDSNGEIDFDGIDQNII